MNLTRIHRDDLEDILCDMLKDISHKEPTLYDKYRVELEDMLYVIDEDEAKEIVMEFKPFGEMFSMPQVKEMITRHNILPADMVEYYLSMNMFYNDFKKYIDMKRLDPSDFCVEMSRMFINDEDAPDHKIAKYFNLYLDEE